MLRECQYYFYFIAMDTQVSKTAPTGEYLTTGSFMIRGVCVCVRGWVGVGYARTCTHSELVIL